MYDVTAFLHAPTCPHSELAMASSATSRSGSPQSEEVDSQLGEHVPSEPREAVDFPGELLPPGDEGAEATEEAEKAARLREAERKWVGTSAANAKYFSHIGRVIPLDELRVGVGPAQRLRTIKDIREHPNAIVF